MVKKVKQWKCIWDDVFELLRGVFDFSSLVGALGSAIIGISLLFPNSLLVDGYPNLLSVILLASFIFMEYLYWVLPTEILFSQHKKVTDFDLLSTKIFLFLTSMGMVFVSFVMSLFDSLISFILGCLKVLAFMGAIVWGCFILYYMGTHLFNLWLGFNRLKLKGHK